jgi:hypothetical protein
MEEKKREDKGDGDNNAGTKHTGLSTRIQRGAKQGDAIIEKV